MGTEVYELADALLAELLESDERVRVLARYRRDHAWDAESVAVVLQLIDDLHSSGRLTGAGVRELQEEIASWSPAVDDDATDQLPVLATVALDDPTEELDDDTDVTVVLPDELQAQLEAAASSPMPGEVEPEVPPEPTPPVLEPGTVLAERYRLEQLIGAGGYSLVFRATDLRREELGTGAAAVALKALRPEKRADPRAIARLKKEFRSVGVLSHAGIIRVLDLDCDTGQWFFTMEFLDGESLAAALRRNVGVPLSLTEALPVLADCAAALDFAHARGQVHGDLKPANLFLTSNGELKLIDWSGGGLQQESDAPHAYGRAATRAYASPEVLEGRQPDRSDDIFSLACIAYELLTAQHPFEGGDAVMWRNEQRGLKGATTLPGDTQAAIERALAWRRHARFASAGAFVEALEEGTAPAPAAAAIAVPVQPEPEVTARPETRPESDIAAAAESDPEPSPAVAAENDSKPTLPDVVAEQGPLPGSRTAPHPAPSPAPLGLRRRVAHPSVQREPESRYEVRKPVLFAAAAIVAALLLTLIFTGSDEPADVTSGSVAPELAEPEQAAEANGEPSVATPELQTETALDAAVPAASVPAAQAPVASDGAASTAVSPDVATAAGQPEAAPLAPAAAPQVTPTAARSAPAPAAPETWISFESADIVVSEAAVAAVLRLQRLEGAGGRVRVQWQVIPGSAAAGEDFAADAGGTAEFADGQSLRAIYVPLLPDAVPEGDESFTVEITSDRRAVRVGPIARVKVTIRDDD